MDSSARASLNFSFRLVGRRTGPDVKLGVAGTSEGPRKIERRPVAAPWRPPMRMSITEVIGVTKKFLREDAGYERVKVSSVVAVETDSKWKVIAEIPGVGTEKKEVLVDDRDGNIIAYKQA